MILAVAKIAVLGSMFMPHAPTSQMASRAEQPVFESITTIAARDAGPSYVFLDEPQPEPQPETQPEAPVQQAAAQPVAQAVASQPQENSPAHMFGTGIANAQTMPVPQVSGEAGLLSPDGGGGSMNIPAPALGDFVSRDSAAAKQAELNRREQELLALQQQMEARVGELHNLENRLQGLLDSANDAQEGKLASLIAMYTNMKPRVAAQALTTMDETLAVRILTGMKGPDAGEIMSNMEPVVAARLSEAITSMQL